MKLGICRIRNRHADLLFEIISRRYQEKPTIVTTNKPFAEWNQLFPNASCVVSLIDRLVHNSEIISIRSRFIRLKEATEQSVKRNDLRVKQKSKKIDKSSGDKKC